MRLSKLFSNTSKGVPSDEAALNARLLIQAGYVHKEMAGVYSYLPLGKLVLDKISNIIKEEMNKIDALEVQMSILQPKDIWEITDRWDDRKVDNWFKTTLKSGQELGIGLTHEEPIVDSLRSFVDSYKDLPIYVYQVQTKFRNELRAKSGLLRGREFLMKDMYSFSLNEVEHKIYYEKVVNAYFKIYKKLGIRDKTYRVYADGGIFNKGFSDEFQTVIDIGEDYIYLDQDLKLGINKEIYSDQNIKKLGLNKDKLVVKKGVEVGNIFSLGSKYTDALGLKYTDKTGQENSIFMGCYGIGVSRLMGLIAELFADDKGLVWPDSISPALVYLITVNTDDSSLKKAEKLYQVLTQNKIEVIYDDRDKRVGEKFVDADLLGIPFRVVISSKIDQDKFEIKDRTTQKIEIADLDGLLKKLLKK
jgi:prolyl-tRNA synthetase